MPSYSSPVAIALLTAYLADSGSGALAALARKGHKSARSATHAAPEPRQPARSRNDQLDDRPAGVGSVWS
jgi:hypothetical protein